MQPLLFFSSPPFLFFAVSFSTFFFLRYGGFGAYRAKQNLPFDAFSQKWLQISLVWFSKRRLDTHSTYVVLVNMGERTDVYRIIILMSSAGIKQWKKSNMARIPSSVINLKSEKDRNELTKEIKHRFQSTAHQHAN